MTDRLDLPDELAILLEKRELENRRQEETPVADDRRRGEDRRQPDTPPNDAD